MKTTAWIALGIIVVMIIFSAYAAMALPEPIVTHWGITGQPDGWSSKIFFFPFMIGLTIVFFVLFLYLPKIDPLKKNYKEFQEWYDMFILIFICFMFYLLIISTLANLGLKINMIVLILPAIGVLFYFIGMMLERTKPNWFVGIRTPWTMSNEEVWKKTHKLGADLFRAFGIVIIVLCAMTLFFRAFETVIFALFIAIIIAILVVPIVYSYLEFEAAKKRGKAKWKHKEKPRKK